MDAPGQVEYPVTSDSPALVVYALGMAVWSAAFLEAWRRRQARVMLGCIILLLYCIV